MSDHGLGKSVGFKRPLPAGTFFLPDSCPRCGKVTTAVGDVTGNAPPEAGDFTICLDCGDIRVFATDMRPRTMNPHEAQAVETESQYEPVRRARDAILIRAHRLKR